MIVFKFHRQLVNSMRSTVFVANKKILCDRLSSSPISKFYAIDCLRRQSGSVARVLILSAQYAKGYRPLVNEDVSTADRKNLSVKYKYHIIDYARMKIT